MNTQNPKSYLLENVEGKYQDTPQKAALFEFWFGWDSKWINLDSEAGNELVVVGEWMPVSIFKYTEINLLIKANGLEDSKGW